MSSAPGRVPEACSRFGTVRVVSRETLVILNPASAGGGTGRRSEALRHRIESICGPAHFVSTGAPGDAIRIAQAATERGVGRILVAGGDGTTSEVVSGVLSALGSDSFAVATTGTGSARETASQRPLLGLLPLGSGWDLARSLGLPRSLDEALAVIEAGEWRSIDAGRVEYSDGFGNRCARHFANEVGVGLSASAVCLVGRTSKRLGARMGFIIGAVGAILSHRTLDVAVEIDGKRVHDGPVSMVVAANGAFFGAGMRVAPGAVIDDGQLEIVLVRGLGVPRLLANLPSLYLGRHGRHPKVSFHAARTLCVIAKGGSPPIDVDGEALGGLPLRAEVLPGALRVLVPCGSGR